MKTFIKFTSYISIVISLFFTTSLGANQNSFSDAKNARELIKMANEQHYQVNLRRVPARNIAQFDTVEHLHISGRSITAYWYNRLQLPNYYDKGIDEVQREFRNSNISLKIIYTPTTSDNYNRVYRQSINPGQIIYATQIAYHAPVVKNPTPQFKGFKKPSLIQGGSKVVSTQASSKPAPTSYDEGGTALLTLYVYKYAGPAKKMISLTGLTLEEAKSKLKKANFPIGYIQDMYVKTSNSKLYGKIFEQTIKEGTSVDKPQYMGVKIYEFPSIKMPDLTKGWTVAKASETGYLSLIHNYTKTYDKAKSGIIFGQSIAPGTSLVKRTLVVVKAYKYESPYDRADFIHLEQAKAVELAKQRNLEYEVITKDIFKHFNSTTLGDDFYQKQNNTVVDVLQSGNKIVFTVVKFTKTEGTMPNLLEMKCFDVVKPMYELKQQIPGLTYKTEYIPEIVYEKSDKVASTKPVAGSTIKSLDKVIIYCRRFSGDRNDAVATIPDLSKKSQKEATEVLNNLGFIKIKVVKLKEFSYIHGTVVMITGNMPFNAIGNKIAKSDTIHLYIADADAEEMYLMPNVVGQSMEDAKAILLAHGYKNIKFLDESTQYVKYSTTLGAGTVIASYPSYKAITSHDSTKELVVRLKEGEKLLSNVSLPSSKEVSNTVLVPSVKATLSETIKLMESKGLVPVVKKVAPKNLSLKGTIGSHTLPPYNTIVQKNTKVSITSYVSSVTVQNVSSYLMSNFMTGGSYTMYYTKEHAVSKLKEQGLLASISYKQTDNTSLHGKVSSQNPKANSNVAVGSTVALVVFGSAPIKPSMSANVKLSAPSYKAVEQIEEFYQSFREAYESKDEGQILSLMSDDWTSNGGGEKEDLEMNLIRTFDVFDEIQYNMSNLNIESLGNSKYKVAYSVNIVGEIYDNDIEHEEKSSVEEEVGISNGKVLILKTYGGQYWSIK